MAHRFVLSHATADNQKATPEKMRAFLSEGLISGLGRQASIVEGEKDSFSRVEEHPTKNSFCRKRML
jgi:hypothetical protein